MQTQAPITILMADDDPDDRLMARDAFAECALPNPLRFAEDGEELMAYLHRMGRYADQSAYPTPGLILLDLLATADAPMRVKEFPLNFAARREGESKLDRAILFDFLAGLYDKTLGKVIPTRFALFGTVGALGVVVHFAVLSALLFVFGERFAIAQTAAVLVAMSFNFWLNNWLTYRDKRLVGVGALLRGWLGFIATCAIGAFANVAIATFMEGSGIHWVLAALAGIVVGSVWNYALSSRFVWGRF